jgi:site-specific DNA recombinase
MTLSHTTRNGGKRYRYYVCSSAQKRGWDTCPSKSIPAGQIEEFVVGQIKCIGRDRALLEEVLDQARRQDDARKKHADLRVGLLRSYTAVQHLPKTSCLCKEHSLWLN